MIFCQSSRIFLPVMVSNLQNGYSGRALANVTQWTCLSRVTISRRSRYSKFLGEWVTVLEEKMQGFVCFCFSHFPIYVEFCRLPAVRWSGPVGSYDLAKSWNPSEWRGPPSRYSWFTAIGFSFVAEFYRFGNSWVVPSPRIPVEMTVCRDPLLKIW